MRCNFYVILNIWNASSLKVIIKDFENWNNIGKKKKIEFIHS